MLTAQQHRQHLINRLLVDGQIKGEGINVPLIRPTPSPALPESNIKTSVTDVPVNIFDDDDLHARRLQQSMDSNKYYGMKTADLGTEDPAVHLLHDKLRGCYGGGAAREMKQTQLANSLISRQLPIKAPFADTVGPLTVFPEHIMDQSLERSATGYLHTRSRNYVPM